MFCTAFRSLRIIQTINCPFSSIVMPKLHQAIHDSDLEGVKLSLNSDNKEEIYNGMTPLIRSVRSKNVEIIDYLLKNKVDINNSNEEGLTPLHNAFISDDTELIRFLVKEGADLNMRTNKGDVPLSVSNNEFNNEFVDEMFEKGAIQCGEILINSAKNNDVSMVKHLLTKPKIVNNFAKNIRYKDLPEPSKSIIMKYYGLSDREIISLLKDIERNSTTIIVVLFGVMGCIAAKR